MIRGCGVRGVGPGASRPAGPPCRGGGASRALAQRTLLEAGASDKARLAYAFRLAASRSPEGREIKVLRALLERRRAAYAAERGAALKLLAVGESRRDAALDPVELAAWTTVASVILNLDEVVSK